MALTGGIGAIQEMYNGYKTKDDKDFTTFISQPFLTSAEQDKLINQLRDGDFFSKMEYDAQLGNWVLLGTLSSDELAARKGKLAAVEATKNNQTQVKGKNFGLGSLDVGAVAELVEGASGVSGIAGAVEGIAGVGDGGEVATAVSEALARTGNSTAKVPPQKTSAAAASGSSPPRTQPPPRKSMFGGFFSSSSSKKAATQKGAEASTDDARRIAELEERVAFLEKRLSLFEEQVIKQLKARESSTAI